MRTLHVISPRRTLSRSRFVKTMRRVYHPTLQSARRAFPSLKRRGGCASNRKSRSYRSSADGVVSSAKCFRSEDFAELTTRPLLSKVASQRLFDVVDTPPFQGGESYRIEAL